MYLKPQYIQVIKKKRDQYRDLLFQVIEEGREKGEFRTELPIEITGMSILGMVNWTYKWYRVDGGKTIEEIANIFTDIVLQSIWTEHAKNIQDYQKYRLINSTTHSI